MKITLQIMYKISAILILMFVVFTGFAQQQQHKTVAEKPKIGLVLSGGGAKGLAHIGVIKVLEEYGIKPDIITGTSMGSIVGALYACGYTVEEMTEINKNLEWELLLSDDEKLQRVAMDEKAELNKYLFQFPIRNNKMDLPSGLIAGQHLESYFSKLFWPLTSHQNFDSLPIPFHCMSVDMISGKTIEHKSGNLVKSIRASMSIPTVLSPVRMDSMLLVDGGVTRNFPVQEAINMGADIIIGVYVGYQEDIKVQDLTSMTDILQRSIALAGIVDARAQYEKCDLLIEPDLGEYGAADFLKGEIIQQLGEKTAREHSDEIRDLALRLQREIKEIPKIEQPSKILITNIEVENVESLSGRAIISESGIEPGDSVSFNDITEAIEYMHGTRYFRKLTYSLKKDEKGEGYILVFQVKENPKRKFKIAPNYDNGLGVGVVTNFTLRNILLPASRFLLTTNIAENPGLSAVLLKKRGKNQRFSDNYFINTYSYKLPYFNTGEKLGSYKRWYFDAGYGIHYAPGLNNQIGGDFLYRFNRNSPNSDLRNIFPEADFNKLQSHEWAYNAFYKINTTDNYYFPTKGICLELSFMHAFYSSSEMDEGRNAAQVDYFVEEVDDPYATLFVGHNYYKTFAKHFTYNFGVAAGFNTDNSGLNGLFMLGGSQLGNRLNFKNFAGYSFAEIYTTNYSMVKSALSVEIATGLYLKGTLNVGNIADTYEDIFENFTNYKLGDYIWGYNIGVTYDSVLGPIQLLVADNNKDGELRWQFSVGFPF